MYTKVCITLKFSSRIDGINLRACSPSGSIVSGLGKTPQGDIVASEAFWDKHTKKQPERKKLKYSPPECLEDLEVMFEGIIVDG
uniref:Uncharacterized protein n=1 Tax=Setaria viridis TaxID=4556 RepID=A0A4V6D736_SETVI|nr:hypothetical protein SEVIR_5G319000v2 [Setaria viridis]